MMHHVGFGAVASHQVGKLPKKQLRSDLQASDGESPVMRVHVSSRMCEIAHEGSVCTGRLFATSKTFVCYTSEPNSSR